MKIIYALFILCPFFAECSEAKNQKEIEFIQQHAISIANQIFQTEDIQDVEIKDLCMRGGAFCQGTYSILFKNENPWFVKKIPLRATLSFFNMSDPIRYGMTDIELQGLGYLAPFLKDYRQMDFSPKPKFAGYKGVVKSRSHAYVFFEMAQGRPLATIRAEYINRELAGDDETIFEKFEYIGQTVASFHYNLRLNDKYPFSIIHLDLHPGNIFVDFEQEKPTVTFIDYSFMASSVRMRDIIKDLDSMERIPSIANKLFNPERDYYKFAGYLVPPKNWNEDRIKRNFACCKAFERGCQIFLANADKGRDLIQPDFQLFDINEDVENIKYIEVPKNFDFSQYDITNFRDVVILDLSNGVKLNLFPSSLSKLRSIRALLLPEELGHLIADSAVTDRLNTMDKLDFIKRAYQNIKRRPRTDQGILDKIFKNLQKKYEVEKESLDVNSIAEDLLSAVCRPRRHCKSVAYDVRELLWPLACNKIDTEIQASILSLDSLQYLRCGFLRSRTVVEMRKRGCFVIDNLHYGL